MSIFSSRLCQISIILIVTTLFSACGGSSASDSAIDTSPQIPQEAVVMVSYNANLTNAIPLANAELDSDNIYIFFQEGSDWSTRGISRVDFYCCKGGTEKHIRFPSDVTSPYATNVDFTQYESGTVRELYADVFFMDQYSPKPFIVNFTITSSTPPPLNIAPTISGSPDNTLVENVFYSFTPNVNDADGDNLTFSITNLPVWANFESNTGTLSGTPSNANIGTASGIVITVSDEVDSVSLPVFSITVTNDPNTFPNTPNTVPTISGTPATTVTEDMAYSFIPNANDADGNSLIFSITNLPSWAIFNVANGAITGTPSNANVGTTSGIVITVSDGVDSVSLPAFSISVVTVTTSVGSAVLSWTPPTENADGSTLTDLGGYKIYYGTTPDNYTTVITVNNPLISTYLADNLPGGNTYYFVVTAMTTNGIESEYSLVGSKTIP